MEDNRKPDYQPWNEEEFQADVFVRGMNWMQKHLDLRMSLLTTVILM